MGVWLSAVSLPAADGAPPSAEPPEGVLSPPTVVASLSATLSTVSFGSAARSVSLPAIAKIWTRREAVQDNKDTFSLRLHDQEIFLFQSGIGRETISLHV